MNTKLDHALNVAGRIAAGFAIAVAVACTVAISYADPEPVAARTQAKPEVVRLDPVVVTMSRDRFEAMHAGMKNDSRLAQVAARLLNRG